VTLTEADDADGVTETYAGANDARGADGSETDADAGDADGARDRLQARA